MRLLALSAAALLMSATAALAAPASVSVAVDAKLQKTFDKTYGCLLYTSPSPRDS